MCENMDNTHARRFDDTVRRRAGERGAIMTLRDCPRAMRVVVDGIDQHCKNGYLYNFLPV